MDQESDLKTNSVENSGLQTSVERTLQLLDSEIEHIRGTETQQGWTSWGLIGAIVAALWLLSDELKVANSRLEIVALAVILFSSITDSVRWLIYQFWQWKVSADQSTKIRWSHEWFSGNELVFVVEFLRSLALLIVAWEVAPRSWLPLSAFSIAYGWYLLMVIAWLALTRAEFPIKQGFTIKGFAYILGFVVPCLTSFLLYLNFASALTGEVVSSFRVGGIIVFISYLILSLAMVTKHSSVLHTLIALRRDLALDRIDAKSAASQVEIALKGMEVSDAIQKDVSPILNLVERLNTITNDLISLVQTMKTHLPEAGASQTIVAAKLDILNAHRESCRAMLEHRASIRTEMDARFQQLMRRRNRILGVSPEAKDFFEQLDGGMQVILQDCDLKFSEYQEAANNYDALLKAGLAPVGSQADDPV